MLSENIQDKLHKQGHNTNFNQFKRTEIIQCGFSNHNGIKLKNQ